jgi:uncharacterized membrane protein YphA (DoxX/SURF4 family)
MNIALWIVQGLLAAVFLGSGLMKATQTKVRMIATGQTGVAPFPLPFIRFIAAMELIGAVGLILPQLTGIAPELTPVAAIGLMIIMTGAAVSHWTLHAYKQVFGINLVIWLLCLFVAIGRF